MQPCLVPKIPVATTIRYHIKVSSYLVLFILSLTLNLRASDLIYVLSFLCALWPASFIQLATDSSKL